MTDEKEMKMYSPKITAALHEIMQKVGYVQKKHTNDFHKYNYAGEGDLLEVLRPAMVEAGLILIPSGRSRSDIDQFGNTVVEVEYTLAHKDGDVWPEKIVAFGCGNDRNKNGVGDKGLYKALTGANKYLLFKTFQIETGDDPENATDLDKGDAAPIPPSNGRDKTTKSAAWQGPLTKTDLGKKAHEITREVLGCADEDQLDAYLGTPDVKAVLEQLKVDLPKWWDNDNNEHQGIKQRIEGQRKSFTEPQPADWKTVAEDIKKGIDACVSLGNLNAYMESEETNLAMVKGHSATAHEFLLTRADNKRALFAQSPTGKAAA